MFLRDKSPGALKGGPGLSSGSPSGDHAIAPGGG